MAFLTKTSLEQRLSYKLQHDAYPDQSILLVGGKFEGGAQSHNNEALIAIDKGGSKE